MLRILRRIVVSSGVAIIAAAALVFYAHVGGLAYNTTPSMPVGYYIALPFFPVERGSIVAACLPKSIEEYAMVMHLLGPGECDGREHVVKIVAATAGDVVDVADDHVDVNGRRIEYSARHRHTQRGVPIPAIRAGRYVVPIGKVWLTGVTAESWDSRYYGFVPRALISWRYTRLGGQAE